MDPKSHILAAAQAVFARHGFRQTAMAMVAEEARLSRQALYHHFDSKEALFAGLVDVLHESALAAARVAARRAAGDAAEAISTVMLAYHRDLMARVAGSPFAAELIEESGRQCGAAVSSFGRLFEKELEGVVTRALRRGLLKLKAGVSARDVVEMVQVAAKGVKATHAGEGEAKYARTLKRMIEVICAGVQETPAKRTQTGTARRMVR